MPLHRPSTRRRTAVVQSGACVYANVWILRGLEVSIILSPSSCAHRTYKEVGPENSVSVSGDYREFIELVAVTTHGK